MAKKTEKPEGLAQLKQDLKSGSPARLYLFHGEEHFLRDHYLSMLKKKLLDGPAAEFNFHRFTQENMDLESFARAVEALPMMAEYSLIQVDDYDLSRLSESSRDTLADILTDIPDYCTVVMVFDTVELKVDGRYKRLKDALSRGTEVEFCRQNQRELTGWIRRHFQPYGKVIDDRECEYLTFVTGGTMTALGSEISKLAAYASGQQITRQDIDAVVEPVLDAEVFNITDAISEGDYGLALEKLRTLLQMQQDPIFLLATIGGHFRRMLWARRIMSAGQGEGALGEMLKSATGRTTHPYVLQKTMTAARRVPDGFCETAMELCLETDLQLKSFSGDDQRLLELLLLRLAQEVRR